VSPDYVLPLTRKPLVVARLPLGIDDRPFPANSERSAARPQPCLIRRGALVNQAAIDKAIAASQGGVSRLYETPPLARSHPMH
jgi:hypothetical protein